MNQDNRERGNYSNKVGTDDNQEFEFRQLSSQIRQNIQEFSRKVGSLNTNISKLVLNRNDQKILNEIEDQQQGATNLAHKIGDQLKALTQMESCNSIDKRRGAIQLERLRTTFTEALALFQKAQRNVADKERESVKAAKFKGHEDNIFEAFEPEPKMHFQTLEVMQEEIPYEDLKNRERAVRKIEEDIQGVNDIFKDLAIMIQEQGDVLDSIEAHVESTHGFVEGANVQLTQAAKHQTASRKKQIILIIILAIIIIILALIIYFSVRNGKKSDIHQSTTTTNSP